MSMSLQQAAESSYAYAVSPAQERRIAPFMVLIASNGVAQNDDCTIHPIHGNKGTNEAGIKTRKRILGALSGGGMTSIQIIGATNIHENTVATHLRKLIVVGLVVVTGRDTTSRRKGGPAPRIFALTADHEPESAE